MLIMLRYKTALAPEELALTEEISIWKISIPTGVENIQLLRHEIQNTNQITRDTGLLNGLQLR